MSYVYDQGILLALVGVFQILSLSRARSKRELSAESKTLTAAGLCDFLSVKLQGLLQRENLTPCRNHFGIGTGCTRHRLLQQLSPKNYKLLIDIQSNSN